MKHTPRKRFGQHFLVDQEVIDKIIHVLNIHPNDFFVEIGPGQGAITQALIQDLNHLYAIEIDRDLADYLRDRFGNKLTLFEQDVLDFDFRTILDEDSLSILRLFGNLPYNITTPILFHALKFAPLIKDMHFMVQKEVADRIVAKPGKKDYGRLSIMLQYFCEATILFTVPETAFSPPPKVLSAVIRLKPHATLPYPVENFELFELIVLKAFNQRRKTIHNSMKEFISSEELLKLNIDPSLRPETLPIDDFAKITNFVFKTKGVIS